MQDTYLEYLLNNQSNDQESDDQELEALTKIYSQLPRTMRNLWIRDANTLLLSQEIRSETAKAVLESSDFQGNCKKHVQTASHKH